MVSRAVYDVARITVNEVKMITQETIAKDLGLSFMTVYRCLSGKGSVSEPTRRRISDYVKKHNYRPNLMARSLVQGKTNIVGLVVPSFSYSYYPEIIQSIQETLKARDYKLLLCLSGESPISEKEELDMLLSIPVDGILMSPTASKASIGNARYLKDNEIPFVLFDRYFEEPDLDCDYVATDSFNGSRKVVEYLLSLGHRRIAYIGACTGNSFAKTMLDGYKAALKGKSVKVDSGLVLKSELTEAGGCSAMRELIRSGVKFTAVQATNDIVAVGVLSACYEAGLKVPEQVSIAGFSDISISKNLSLPLTTVKEPTEDIGRIASEALLDMIENGTKKRKKLKKLLTGSLIVRESCAAL